MPSCGESDCAKDAFWPCDGCGLTLCNSCYRILAQIPIHRVNGTVKPSGMLLLCSACHEKTWRLVVERA